MRDQGNRRFLDPGLRRSPTPSGSAGTSGLSPLSGHRCHPGSCVPETRADALARPRRSSCSTNSGASRPGTRAGARRCCETALLDRVPAAEFHFPDVDAPDLAVECVRYRELINDGGLDLAVLGLGANGHLGLNEPGSTADQTTRVVELTEETREGRPPVRGRPAADLGPRRRIGRDPGRPRGLAPRHRVAESCDPGTGD